MFIQHSTLYNGDSVMTYCYEYSPEDLHTRWVAFRFDNVTRAKNTTRNDSFDEDPSLPAAYHHGAGGFGKVWYDLNGKQQTLASGSFDRGHICASADRLYSKAANIQTFYMSNMSPQKSKFNQQYWLAYEQYVQDLGRNSSFADTLYVVKGASLGADGIEGYVLRDGNKKVSIPKNYYMALLKVKNGKHEAIAFWVEHRIDGYGMNSDDVNSTEMKKRAISIDQLEELTGVDFFPNLADEEEVTVEASYSASAWNL